MGLGKKNTKDVTPKYKANGKKPKKFPKLRRHVHRNADTILIFLHSLLPLTIGGYLIYQGVPNDPPKPNFLFGYFGIAVGIVAIVLHLIMIVRSLVSKRAAYFMNWLMLTVDVVQFLLCVVSSSVMLVFTGKEYITLAGISLANTIFCILPAFLAFTSLMNTPKNSETHFSVTNPASYASGRAKPAVVIKRIPDDTSVNSRSR
ncbi:unnamed protein product [Rodentolepis nana]|uniref:DUF4870 domain-containing protein n=1 Tax=Rodentolepis nana TaxID=102285 RepID=A0A0R3TW99_RODNA|nr:unnamed protein product [Rodentolepis nana]